MKKILVVFLLFVFVVPKVVLGDAVQHANSLAKRRTGDLLSVLSVGEKKYVCNELYRTGMFNFEAGKIVLFNMGYNFEAYQCVAGWPDKWVKTHIEWCEGSDIKKTGDKNAEYCIYQEQEKRICAPVLGGVPNGCLKATCNSGYEPAGEVCRESSRQVEQSGDDNAVVVIEKEVAAPSGEQVKNSEKKPVDKDSNVTDEKKTDLKHDDKSMVLATALNLEVEAQKKDEVTVLTNAGADVCADSLQVVTPIGDGKCAGRSSGRVSVNACVKHVSTGDVIENVNVYNVNSGKEILVDEKGCFKQDGVAETDVLRIVYSDVFEEKFCAAEFKNKSIVCLNFNMVLTTVEQSACAGSVLSKLNALDGVLKSDENGQGYCDIVCPDGYVRQENVQTLQFKDASGNTFDSQQKYICVAKKSTTVGVVSPQKQSDDLKDIGRTAKKKENLMANNLLGAASMATTGIGGMQALSAYSEQQADEDAEQAMKAYLATFHCNYGAGMNVQGGEKNVELPGGNDLVNLYSEYVNLANNLKVRKAALEMKPGIEAESILDSATSGLYDDVSIGKTNGAFASLARALQNPNGEDAAVWAKQKSDRTSQMKTGLMMAGVGAVGGVVGNVLINGTLSKNDKSNVATQKKNEQEIAVKSGVEALEYGDKNVVVADLVNENQGVTMVARTTNSNVFDEEVLSVVVDNDASLNGVVEKNKIVKQTNRLTNKDLIVRIENISDPNLALDALAVQFEKQPSDAVKYAWSRFAEQCKGYNGVLSVEEESDLGADLYGVYCYFPDLDQTEEFVREAYKSADGKKYFDVSTDVAEKVKIEKQAPFKDTRYAKQLNDANERYKAMNATWSTRVQWVQIDENTRVTADAMYSAQIRITTDMVLMMVKPDGKNRNYEIK